VSAIRFSITARSACCRARVGRVETPHGTFETPAFMPVGTRASVRGIVPEWVAQTGAQILLNNTFHLMLRPGSGLIARFGGVHRFMNWGGPILTDSGGFQAFSMSDSSAVDDDGVTFRSSVDGSLVRLTPETAMRVQNELGADIIMALDDCPPAASEEGDEDSKRLAQSPGRQPSVTHAERLHMANERTLRWLERCAKSHARSGDQALFGIVQGGTDLERRSWCVERVCAIDLPGYAIGGVAVGESPEEIARVVRYTAPMMPDYKPRYLMGVGYERDLVMAVRAGVDMFDCVLPTRNGRNANAFTSRGQIRLRNAAYAEDPLPIEPGCDCHACDPCRYGWKTAEGRGFSRAYLRHLFMVGEMLGPILVSLHNLRHFQRLMSDLRATIRTGDWAGLEARWPVVSGTQASD
jgi:queuine tRNA-ribosyltransferase